MKKKPIKLQSRKLDYQAPQIRVTEVLLEHGIAAGSNGQASGDIQQTWDNEESQTHSQSDGWW